MYFAWLEKRRAEYIPYRHSRFRPIVVYSTTLMNCDFLPSLIKLCTSDEVSNKELYPTFARTIFDDNSIAPSVLAILNHFDWNLVGIISENEEGWERRGDFLDSFLKSEGKTVSMHGKVQYVLLYHAKEEYSQHYEQVMREMKDKVRSKYLLIFFSYIAV